MTAHASSMPVTGPILVPAEEFKHKTRPSLAARLLNAIMVAQQRKADREILRYSSILHDQYRQEFGLELERRIMGQ
jgi:hypothetical protein